MHRAHPPSLPELCQGSFPATWRALVLQLHLKGSLGPGRAASPSAPTLSVMPLWAAEVLHGVSGVPGRPRIVSGPSQKWKVILSFSVTAQV